MSPQRPVLARHFCTLKPAMDQWDSIFLVNVFCPGTFPVRPWLLLCTYCLDASYTTLYLYTLLCILFVYEPLSS